jgi:rare lipoprotein A (peptidoglycan hydrolase)
VNIAVTVALVPALFIGRSTSPKGPVTVAASDTLQTLPVVATAAPGSNHVVVLGPSDIAAEGTTTTTTTPPPPPTTVVRKRTSPTVKPVSRPAVRPKVVPAPTTTAKPRPKSTTTTTPVADGTESGKASWYDHQPGICAHKSLPFGTVVTVTNTANGKSTRCTVGDRGPYVDGWIIDLNPREFEQLAPRSTGVISVRLTW